MTDSGAKIPATISVRPPTKYAPKQDNNNNNNNNNNNSTDAFVAPPLEWLYRTWSVTHSTLSMWRTAQNVRITYKPYDKPDSSAVDDLVEYEKKGATSGGASSVEGIDKPGGGPGAWDWRGKGWLKIASSHWEILGYGERPAAAGGDGGGGGGGEGEGGVERWVVTWFAPTLFTQEGLDIYSDRKEGLSQETVDGIMTALKQLDDAPKIVTLAEKHMLPVQISLPWQERK